MALLSMRCAHCATDTPDGFRFCAGCGRPLAGRGAQPREERKWISAVFCDVVGFTSRAERLDAEDVQAFLERFRGSVLADLRRFGGTPEARDGDAVLALFRSPRAHEDDPERAVRAALASLDALAELNAADPELD